MDDGVVDGCRLDGVETDDNGVDDRRFDGAETRDYGVDGRRFDGKALVSVCVWACVIELAPLVCVIMRYMYWFSLVCFVSFLLIGEKKGLSRRTFSGVKLRS